MTLLNTINSAKAELKPLPKHYLANTADAHLREQYATLLGAVMTDNGSVSPYQSAYFADLLKSMDLDGEPSRYLTASQKLDKSDIVQLVKQLGKSAHIALLFDIIILLRIDSPFTSQQTELTSAVADVFEMSKDDVALASFWADMALGLGKNSEEINNLVMKTVKRCNFNFHSKNKLKISPLEKGDFIGKGFVIATGYLDIRGNKVKPKGLGGFSLIVGSDFIKESNIKVVPFKNRYAGIFLKIDKKDSISYTLLPIPKSLEEWSKFFSEVYPAQPI